MSRHQFHVATSFLPTVGFPGRDTKNPCRDLKSPLKASNTVATSKFQVATLSRLTQVATSNRCRYLKLSIPSRNMDFHVTTRDFLLLTSAKSRHQKRCRNTNSSSLGRDAKTMSRPRLVWTRSRARCPGRGRALALSYALLRARPPLPYAPAAFLSRPQH